jgi:hypothetical protein
MELSFKDSAPAEPTPENVGFNTGVDAPIDWPRGRNITEWDNPIPEVTPASDQVIPYDAYPSGKLDWQMGGAAPTVGAGTEGFDVPEGHRQKSITDPIIEARAKAAGRAVDVPDSFWRSRHSDKKWDSEAHDPDVVRWNGDLICIESVDGRYVENCKYVNPTSLGAPWNLAGHIESDLFDDGS